MDARNQLLATGFFVVAAAVTALALGWGVAAYRSTWRQAQGLADQLDRDQASAAPRPERPSVPPPSQTVPESVRDRQVRILQALLEEKTQQLTQWQERFRQLQQEHQRLQQQYDEAMEAAARLIAAGAARPTPGQAQEEGAQGSPEPEPAAGDLRRELEKAELVQEELAREVEQLRGELELMQLEMETLRQQSQEELAAVLQRDLVIQEAANQALISLGAQAVPALVQALRSDDVAVRRWAAGVLARIGPNAQEAVPSLTDALLDPDPQVRTLAQSALEAIARR